MTIQEFFDQLAASTATQDQKNGLILDYLKKIGSAHKDYPDFKAQMDEVHSYMATYGIEHQLYEHLASLVDWRSDFSKNILLYIVEKVTPLIQYPPSDQTLYNAYIEDKKENIFPFSEKPELNGDRADTMNIKTQEAKDFWKGYFSYAVSVLKEINDTQQGILSDPNHQLHQAYTIGKKIDMSWLEPPMLNRISSEDVAKMTVATNFWKIKPSAFECKSRLENMQKLYATTDIIITARIGTMAKSLINKFIK